MSAVLPFQNKRLSIEKRVHDLVSRLSTDEKISLLMHDSPAIERLEIPAYNWINECIHGIARAGKATVFPQAIGLAAMFDSRRLTEIAEAVSDEARAKYAETAARGNRGIYRGLTFFSPHINIYRDPRWGRGQETYGEDPFLTGTLGALFVETLQQSKQGILKTAACAKHFAVHSGPEEKRQKIDNSISRKDMRETYLPAFKALVDAGVETVMAAQNKVNGRPCCAHEELLETILRKEWGFSGTIISDWDALSSLHTSHKVTESRPESAALALKHGLDLNCGTTFEALVDALALELIEETDLDNALSRVMSVRFRLGMFNRSEDNPWRTLPSSLVDSEKHRSLARLAARESLVLLKNDHKTLPLSNELDRILVTGPNAANIHALLGNYYGVNGHMTTPLEGITRAVAPHTVIGFHPGVPLYSTADGEENLINPFNYQIIIAFMGIDSSIEGEEGDTIASQKKGDRDDIRFPEHQLRYLRQLKATGKPLIVVVNGGGPMLMNEVHQIADAVIWSWYPGEEGGNALADVLFGNQAPAGRLPVTFPMRQEDLPDYESYSMEGRTYRFLKNKPMYPFGFGLSYSKFRYSAMTLSTVVMEEGETLSVTVEVINAGPYPAEEVTQLYVSYPEAPFRTPNYDLRGFQRIFLDPGQTKIVAFNLSTDQLSVYNDEGDSLLLKGTYRLYAGGCSPGERGVELGAGEPEEARLEIRD